MDGVAPRMTLLLVYLSAVTFYVTTAETTAQTGCPCGWLLYEEFCYYYHNKAVNQPDARTYCQDAGGDLVSILSKEENEYVKGLMKEDSWIGLEVNGSGVSRWLDGSQLGYQNFQSSSSVPPDMNLTCSYMRNVIGEWIQQLSNCHFDEHTFVCKKNKSIREKKCAYNYCIFPECKSYQEAESACKESWENLAKFSTDKPDYIIPYEFETIWTLSNYSSSSKCRVMLYSEQGGKTEDSDDCTTLHPYICANTSTTVTTSPISITTTATTPPSTDGIMASDTSTINKSNLATTNTPTTSTTTSSDANTKFFALIAGIIVAVLVCILAIVIIFTVVAKFRRKKKRMYEDIESRPIRNRVPSIIEEEPEEEHDNVYDNIAMDSDVIPVSKLKDHICKLKQTENGFLDEFKKIPKQPRGQYKVGDSQTIQGKNRYRDVLPYDNHRVLLSKEPDDEEGSDYINASYIDGYKREKMYIAAQGPVRCTLNDFWKMVWEQNIQVILMLTNIMEKGRNKCDQYWPEVNRELNYGGMMVRNNGESITETFIMRQFSVRKKGEERYVTQVHDTAWVDMGAPTNVTRILWLRRLVHDLTADDETPVLVHCSAGIGRTGSYIAVDYSLAQAADTGEIDIMACINAFRDQRVNMVQTAVQYQLIYLVLLEGILLKESNYPVETYHKTFEQLELVSGQYEEQFEILDILKPVLSESDTQMARLPDNLPKNRTTKVLPSWQSRVLLSQVAPPEEKGSTTYVNTSLSASYINAVYVDSYESEKAFIATQMPLADTSADFWRMVTERGSPCIVMLNLVDPDQDAPPYWPPEGETLSQGHNTVCLVASEVQGEPPVNIRQIEVSMMGQHGEEKQTVTQVGVTVDLSQLAEDDLINHLLAVLERVPEHMTVEDRPVTVHCMFGYEYSGLYCALAALKERMIATRCVDVYQTVKTIRQGRPSFITDVKQYRLLHKGARIIARSLPPASQVIMRNHSNPVSRVVSMNPPNANGLVRASRHSNLFDPNRGSYRNSKVSTRDSTIVPAKDSTMLPAKDSPRVSIIDSPRVSARNSPRNSPRISRNSPKVSKKDSHIVDVRAVFNRDPNRASSSSKTNSIKRQGKNRPVSSRQSVQP